MPDDRAEVIVLGAGIAGCALAYYLIERKVGPVVVYDPRTPSAGATGRAAGIVTQQLWDRWDVDVSRESKVEYSRLARLRDPTAFTENGFARWTRNPEAAAILQGAADRLRSWGVRVESIEPDALARRVPWGRFDDVRGAIWSPDDAVVTPSAITEIYAESARLRGVDFWLGTPLESFRKEGGAWTVSSGARSVRARRAVIAAGAWSKELLRQIGHPLPLAPYRTQAALLRPTTACPPDLPSVHDIDLDVYVRPESNGRIMAGDGTELVEVDPETFRTGGDETFVTHLAESFDTRFPGWADAELVRAWAGVCTSTPDRRPMVGPVPSAEGLYTLTGFNGFGVMRAGGIAQRLAAVLAAGEGSRSELDGLAPVLPGRFRGALPAFRPRPGFTLESGDNPRF
jgi:glycine/D-amino acid oxidase-like deaminating enzyme